MTTEPAPGALGSNDQLGLMERLRQRTLPMHGGSQADSLAHHWNLTPGDSELHAEAARELERLEHEVRFDRRPSLEVATHQDVAPVATVEILPTHVWIENDPMGARHVVCQHAGRKPFTYATFHYDCTYTDNARTWDAAHQLAVSLGAAEPVETRARAFSMSCSDQPAAPPAEPNVEMLRRALQDCRLFAARNRGEEWAKKILRFCAQGGVRSNPLRAERVEGDNGK